MSDDAWEKLRAVAARDKRYAVAAYPFIFESLAHTMKRLGRSSGHVTGVELLEGFRDKALAEFGGLATMVLHGWGIRSTDDVGEMVFNLVEADLMGRTERDTREEFHAVFDFAVAFPAVGQRS